MQAIKLPNPELAYVNDQKLLGYSLNYDHPDGKHKARVFDAVFSNFAIFEKENNFGELYRLDFSMTYGGKTAIVRTGWVILEGEGFARLTTCFIKI